MISLREPQPTATAALLQRLRQSEFSYPDVGATREEFPASYNIDRNSVLLGKGEESFRRARAAMLEWTPFHLDWIKTCPEADPAEGVQIAVLIWTFGLWWTNVSRVIYVIDEPTVFAFAYGTLKHHAESGEERFQVRWDPDTGAVTYSIEAFSRPRHLLARLGAPFARAAQKRFARDSMAAMQGAQEKSTALD